MEREEERERVERKLDVCLSVTSARVLRSDYDKDGRDGEGEGAKWERRGGEKSKMCMSCEHFSINCLFFPTG